MKTIAWLGLAGCTIAWLSCGGRPFRDGPVERVSTPLLYFDPIGVAPIYRDLVGRGLNGRSWQGRILDGRIVEWVSLRKVSLPHGPPRDLRLEATVFLGVPAERIAGAIFQAMLDDGTTIPLLVGGVLRNGEKGRGFFSYLVLFEADGRWQSLCGLDDEGRPVPAIPLEGRWDYREGTPTGGAHIPDPDRFTFACEDRVLAKCVRMGYSPWTKGFLCRTSVDGKRTCEKTTLAPIHQACSRALRADYCGDGISYTQDGMWTLVRDGIGIRGDSEDWVFEAEWDEQGARCLSHERLMALEGIPCQDALWAPDCGDPAHFETGTWIMTEIPPDDSEEEEIGVAQE